MSALVVSAGAAATGWDTTDLKIDIAVTFATKLEFRNPSLTQQKKKEKVLNLVLVGNNRLAA